MVILGLHFGHDAAASIIIDGKVVAYVMRERISRIKHALGLDKSTIDAVLGQADLRIIDIDYVAISSTQKKELIFTEQELFSVSFKLHPKHRESCGLFESYNDAPSLNSDLKHYLLDEKYRNTPAFKAYSLFYPEYSEHPEAIEKACGWMDTYITDEFWQKPKSLLDIEKNGFKKYLETEHFRKGFHYPVTVNLLGHTLPGYFIHHHMCHAACSYYTSEFESAAIMTHDGHSRPENYDVGMFYYAKDHKIFPLMPHHLFLGALYDFVGGKLNLGVIGAAGKLMGLSSWGKSTFNYDDFIGNWYDFKNKFSGQDDYRKIWFEYCISQLKTENYDLTNLANIKEMTNEVNADIALTTQKLFEATYLQAISTLFKGLSTSGIDESNLCLSGGTALNCPSNSKVWQKSEFKDISIEPCCDDSGIAIGAALALYHNVFDQPRVVSPTNFTPYLGMDYQQQSNELNEFIVQYPNLECKFLNNAPCYAAELLMKNKVIGWFEGRSEIGPRALGHRSIIANPCVAENWQRVNKIKKRELWRPFAPVVLVDDIDNWFEQVPNPSPYMLFNANVINADIPAVTHVDNSARIQSVDESCGGYYQLLKHFKELSQVSVLMNTSFNGPGEPIVETPDNALEFFAKSELDNIFINGWLVSKIC